MPCVTVALVPEKRPKSAPIFANNR